MFVSNSLLKPWEKEKCYNIGTLRMSYIAVKSTDGGIMIIEHSKVTVSSTLGVTGVNDKQIKINK